MELRGWLLMVNGGLKSTSEIRAKAGTAALLAPMGYWTLPQSGDAGECPRLPRVAPPKTWPRSIMVRVSSNQVIISPHRGFQWSKQTPHGGNASRRPSRDCKPLVIVFALMRGDRRETDGAGHASGAPRPCGFSPFLADRPKLFGGALDSPVFLCKCSFSPKLF